MDSPIHLVSLGTRLLWPVGLRNVRPSRFLRRTHYPLGDDTVGYAAMSIPPSISSLQTVIDAPKLSITQGLAALVTEEHDKRTSFPT